MVFVSGQCHHLHYLINPAQPINNNIFIQMWDYNGSLDLIITTKTKQNWITSREVLSLAAQLFIFETFSFTSDNRKNTRLVERIVWVKWSLQVCFSITFQVNQQFNFPFSLNKWKLTSTCQNSEISISIAYCNYSAELVSCSLNKFVGKA